MIVLLQLTFDATIRQALEARLTTLNTLGIKGTRTYRRDIGAQASNVARILREIEASVREQSDEIGERR